MECSEQPPDVARSAPLPQPIDLVIIDLPEIEEFAPSSDLQSISAWWSGAALEPQVPTGDVGEPEQS